jgi:hypothetical protein
LRPGYCRGFTNRNIMKQKYPLFFRDNDNLTVVVSPISAFQYRDTNNLHAKANGFEFYNFTNRKTIRKLEKSVGNISCNEFIRLLIMLQLSNTNACFSQIIMSLGGMDKRVAEQEMETILDSSLKEMGGSYSIPSYDPAYSIHQ